MLVTFIVMVVTCLADFSNWQQARSLCTKHVQCKALCILQLKDTVEKSTTNATSVERGCNVRCCLPTMCTAAEKTQWGKAQQMQPVWKEVTNHMQLCDNCTFQGAYCFVCEMSAMVEYVHEAKCMPCPAYRIPTKPTVWLQSLVYAGMPTVCHARDRFEWQMSKGWMVAVCMHSEQKCIVSRDALEAQSIALHVRALCAMSKVHCLVCSAAVCVYNSVKCTDVQEHTLLLAADQCN